MMPRSLLLLGAAALPIYGAIAALSSDFQPDLDPLQRPLGLVLILFAAATLIYLLSLAYVFRSAGPGDGVRLVLIFSLVYRLILLPSWPIQEIDFYRYLWDGRAVLAGMNPYHFSPGDIDDADESATGELASLRELTQQSVSVHTIFGRIHYREIPTSYPPAAQLVFALSGLLTPAAAPVAVHILVLKCILVAFDLGIVVVLLFLLRRLGLPEAWCIAYGWCPLALKEVANSGHMDSIPAFFTLLALYWIIGPARSTEEAGHGLNTGETRTGTNRNPVFVCFGMAALAIAALAKGYPLAVLPIACVYLWKRIGIRLLAPLVVFGVVFWLGFLPFRQPGPHHAGSGVGRFLFTRWEMNDLLFMVVYRNISRPLPEGDPWFVVVSEGWRDTLNEKLLDPIIDWEHFPEGADAAYLLAMLMMGAVVGVICLLQCVKMLRRPEPIVLLRGCFLVIAWGWLLSSTQNPWYVLWCLPLMVFARGRAWFLMPALALAYYLRFWMVYHAPDTPHEAWTTFDYGVVWLEHLPVLIALAAERILRSDWEIRYRCEQ
jgi:hypothetical protein